MVKRLVPALLAAAILVGIAAAGCTLLVDGAPDNVCRNDSECFRAQGEVCDTEAKKCIVRGDAGVPRVATDAGVAGD